MISTGSSLKKTLTGKLAPLTYSVLLLYIFLPGLILNYRLLFETLTSSAELDYKLSLFSQILLGSVALKSPLELFFLLLTALLLGMNVALLSESISLLRKEKKLSLAFGGTTIAALTAAGCASCGISLLSILGISSSFLPMNGIPLYIFSSSLLLLSLIIVARTHAKVCKI